MKQFAVSIAASLLLFLLAASADAQQYGDITVKVENVIAGYSGTGYAEYRAIIANHSNNRSHTVTIEMASWEVVRRSVEVAPSSAGTIDLIIPAAWVSYVNILIDGSLQNGHAQVDEFRTRGWVVKSPINSYYLLISGGVDQSGLMNDPAVLKGFTNSAGMSDVAYLVYKSPMNEWSANWIAYSSFHGVAITAAEMRDAPEAVRSALWRLVECGGSLLIIGASEIPEQWRSRRVDSDVSAALYNAAQNYNLGFGNVTIIDTTGLKRILPRQWEAIKEGWESSPGKTYRELTQVNHDFPVVKSLGIPVRGLFIMMLIFVLVSGPLNIHWLARKGRKIWILLTVPGIALVTCMAIATYALLSEGMSATSLTESLTILDESAHHASTIGWTAFYAPVNPGDGLHFSYDTEWTMIPQQYSRSSRTIDLSRDQHLDSGWMLARAPIYFKFRKSETRRERLTIRRDGPNSISVVNGLGAAVRELWFKDRDGMDYMALGIPAGAETKLKPQGYSQRDNKTALRDLFKGGDWLSTMRGMSPETYLAPGCYLATLDANPFFGEGLESVKIRNGRALVYGLSAVLK